MPSEAPISDEVFSTPFGVVAQTSGGTVGGSAGFYRLLESGDGRLLEGGDFRLLE